MGRPREHDEITRLELLDAAERIVDGHGPDAVTVRNVATQAGTSTRAVYNLFGSKIGLLAALATRAFVVLGEYVDEVTMTSDPVDDLVTVGVRGFRRFAVARPALFRLAFQRIVPLDLGHEFWLTADKTFGKLIGRVQRAAALGRLGGRDPVAVATEYTALCEGLMTVELRGRLMAEGAEDMWLDALNALVRGYDTATKKRPPARASSARGRGAGGTRRTR